MSIQIIYTSPINLLNIPLDSRGLVRAISHSLQLLKFLRDLCKQPSMQHIISFNPQSLFNE